MLLDKYTVYTVNVKSAIENGLKHTKTAKVGSWKENCEGWIKKRKICRGKKREEIERSSGMHGVGDIGGEQWHKREITRRGGTSEEVQNNLTSICTHTHMHTQPKTPQQRVGENIWSKESSQLCLRRLTFHIFTDCNTKRSQADSPCERCHRIQHAPT